MAALLALAGCAAQEGTFSPSCPAFAGSLLELKDGQFTWTKFTDEVVVDADGKKVDRFPGFPLTGTYRVDGDEVSLTTSTGESLDRFYLHEVGDELYLYTAKEFDHLEKTGEAAKCALKREAPAGQK